MRILLLIALLVLLVGCTRCPDCSLDSYGPGSYSFTILVGGEKRLFLVDVPQSYNGTPLPVIVNFHGGGGSAEGARRQSDLDIFAEEKNFIAVFPESTGRVLGATKNWNAGARDDPRKQKTVDDVAFVETMLDYISEKFAVDQDHIFAVGLSNGGMMTYHVLCKSDRFAGGVSVASTLITEDCMPSKAYPVLDLHGVQDRLIPIDGGHSDPELGNIAPTEYFISQNETVTFWAENNNCDLETKIYFENNTTTCYAFQNCEEPVQYCVIGNGGHTWPGAEGFESNQQWYLDAVGPISYDVSANDAIWTFFSAVIAED